MTTKTAITVIPGDGVGMEVVTAAMRVMEAANASVEWEICDAGKKVFERGIATGVPQETLVSLSRTHVALKGPLETPIGYGGKSANVTLRKMFETYGNLRPVKELPGVITPFSGRGIDLVVVRENVEDLYAGIEHMQTADVAQCLKLVSRKGCEKIVRLAFEVARAEGRKSVHCCTKANIMKMTEGLLKQVFEEISPEYPEIMPYQILVDNCAHQLVRRPEQFEVIVTTNMNGDILSDLTSGLVGGLGLAASSNIGSDIAIFEAVHGSAPDIAGKNIVNPIAIILSSVLMLNHIGQTEVANAIEHAVFCTLERGIMTSDLAPQGNGVGTKEFTEAVVKNLGIRSIRWSTREAKPIQLTPAHSPVVTKKTSEYQIIGADIFIESGLEPQELGSGLEALITEEPLRLKMMSNRGTKVYPTTSIEPDCVDHYRCRFVFKAGIEGDESMILKLLQTIGIKYRWMHVELLRYFDGKKGYTLAQGEEE